MTGQGGPGGWLPPVGELAVVTGAARGIGAAIARRLAADGWALLLVDACAPQPGAGYAMPEPGDLAAVALDCRAAGAPWAGQLVADVGDGAVRDQIRRAAGDRVPAAAVAAAGLIAGHPAWAVPDEAFDSMIRVNLYGVRHLADACVPAMVAAGRGRFVAISSAAALRAMPMLAAYSAAKGAVTGYVRALAADLAGTGVTANVVCPGSTRGAMLAASAAIYDLPDQEDFAAQALLRRVLDPAEVAAAVAWLCGPDASALTGAVIPVDAGLSALARPRLREVHPDQRVDVRVGGQAEPRRAVRADTRGPARDEPGDDRIGSPVDQRADFGSRDPLQRGGHVRHGDGQRGHRDRAAAAPGRFRGASGAAQRRDRLGGRGQRDLGAGIDRAPRRQAGQRF
ncbi:MAG TPA: mycofactocin-coupled SDR family oxidoreductase, partial [Streptosporangiaceae bacterium]|nr:mycofactocin-coupled SDR family oxidoreductase [Streptosporangiaceae bacterium]